MFTEENATSLAEYRNMFMVSIDLQRSRRRRSTPENKMAEGYEISLSNDGTNFGNPSNIIIYNDSCYSCNATLVTCFELVSISWILPQVLASYLDFVFVWVFFHYIRISDFLFCFSCYWWYDTRKNAHNTYKIH